MVSLPPRAPMTSAPLVLCVVMWSVPVVPGVVLAWALVAVVDSTLVLLAGFGSDSAAEAIVVAVMVPVAAGSMVMVMVADALAASVPMGHDTAGGLIVHVPCDGP